MQLEYLQFDPNHITKFPLFLIHGKEVILRNEIKDRIKTFISNESGSNIIVLDQSNLNDLETIIKENISDDLFGQATTVIINHHKGTFPKAITDFFADYDFPEDSDIKIIIDSTSEKINQNLKWIKKIKEICLQISCPSMKTLIDEKKWVRSKLDFLTSKEIDFLLDDLITANRGNLQSMNNDIKVIKVLCQKEESKSLALANLKLSFQMSPFEIEDKILLGDSKNVIKIIYQLKQSDPNSLSGLLWIINKITYNSVMAKNHSDAQSSLQKANIWSNKVPLYIKFLNKHEGVALDVFYKRAFWLDQYWKGSKKGDIWQEVISLVKAMCSS